MNRRHSRLRVLVCTRRSARPAREVAVELSAQAQADRVRALVESLGWLAALVFVEPPEPDHR
jgi:hypothetical protein